MKNQQEINRDLEAIKGNTLLSIEFKKMENLLMLTFCSMGGDKFNVLKLLNCHAFKDLGVYDLAINEVLVKEVGHFFREYCIAKGIDFNNLFQIEVYPADFRKTENEDVYFKTFFAICQEVEMTTLLSKPDFW